MKASICVIFFSSLVFCYGDEQAKSTEVTKVKITLSRFLDALKNKKLEQVFPLYSEKLKQINIVDSLLLVTMDSQYSNDQNKLRSARAILDKYYDESGAESEISKIDGQINNTQKLIAQAKHIKDPISFNAACRSHLKSNELLPNCVADIDDFVITIDKDKATAKAWDGLYFSFINEFGEWKFDVDMAYRAADKRP